MGKAVRDYLKRHPKELPPTATVPPQLNAGRFLSVALIGLAFVTMVLLVLNLRETGPGKKIEVMPTEVLGQWTTTDPRYADRGLEVSRDAVVFGLGPGQPPRRGRIVSLRSWQEGLVEVVRIEYDAGEGAETMELLMVGPDSMRLRNPREVLWTKEP